MNNKDEILTALKKLDIHFNRIDEKLDSIENSLDAINQTVGHSTETLKYICIIINLDDLQRNDVNNRCND